MNQEPVSSQLPRSVDELPPALVSFLRDSDIDPAAYAAAVVDDLPRFIRISTVNPVSVEELTNQLQLQPSSVSWLPGFYELPGHVKIANLQAYKNGQIAGIDISSGVAVAALSVNKGDHVLDLCTAPGAKFCMISDLLGASGSVTGVDISQERLSACRSLAKKYQLQRSRLFLADGTNFSIKAPVASSADVNNHYGKKRASKRRRLDESVLQGRRPFYVSSDMKDWNVSEDGPLYDKVIVDAECTHDGSIKHILKYDKWGWDTFEERFLNPDRLQSLQELQRKLISNGFGLLKPGGTLVYSTCSFSKRQNEDIVQYLLDNQSSAELASLESVVDIAASKGRIVLNGCGLRFDPGNSGTSGLFVARLRKRDLEKMNDGK